ncbi:MAG: metallophosphoesterase [Bacteroidetes bacterium]|nr:metallophosphoesterase [Bacteroidota bacterium]
MSDTFKSTLPAVKCHLNIVAMTFLFIVVAMLCGCSKSKPEQQPPVGTDETLRFVWLADSRGDTLEYPVNTPVMTAIINQIAALSPKPSFVFFGGDQSYRGYIKPSYTFQAWKDLFAPLGSGIPLYTAIGNHELYHQHASYGYLLVNQQEYQNVFSENPANGPPGYDHLAYTFTSQGGNSFFAVLDPYYITKDTVHMGLGGHIDSIQMSWLKAQVAKTRATHKFLFIHTPYYYISDDPQEPSAADTSLTLLWSFLDANKFDIYACGHSHLFSRRTIDSSIPADPATVPPTPAWQNNVVQLLNGTCGAGPSTGNIYETIKTLWNVHNDANTYYFSVIDINGGTVTVKSYGGNTGAYSLVDTFTVTR